MELVRPQILVVDDEEPLLALMQRVLSARYQVVMATDGEAALRALTDPAHSIRLVILDLTMPEMDGPALMTRLRAQHAGLPVAVMSGLNEEEAIRVLKGQRPDAYLRKPVRLAQLTAVVDRLLAPVVA